MAKVKAVLRGYTNKAGEQTVYLRIYEDGEKRYVSTGIKMKPRFWNKRKGRVRKNDQYDEEDLNKIIKDKEKAIEDEAWERKAGGERVNADILKKKAKQEDTSGDYIQYAKKFADRKRRKNVQTGRRYDAIVSKLESYTGGTLKFKDITVTWLKDYMDWLATERGNKANTIHSNMRAIRAILYAAIDEDLFPQERNPFFKLTLKQPKVSKTKLTVLEIKAFSGQETTSDFQELAKDLFLFSFFTQGMRFRDVAMLKYKYLTDTHIVYEMNKTENAQSVEINPAAKAIIEKYRRADGKAEDFVFPLVDADKVLRNLKLVDEDLTVADLEFSEATSQKEIKIQKELDRDVSSKNAYVNKEIKKVATAAEIPKKISFHVARHSYADIARSKNADLHALSKSLGHSSLKVTENYLQSLGNDSTNEAAQTVYEEFNE
jgi:site-specific recombinase XerD